MRERQVIAVFCALLALLLAAGCGGDDPGGPDGTAQGSGGDQTNTVSNGSEEQGAEGEEADPGIPAKPEFVERANAICAERAAEVQRKGQKAFTEVSDAPEKVFAKKMTKEIIIPVFQREVRELRELGTPAGDEQQLGRLYAVIEKMLDRLKVNPTYGDFYPYKKAEKLAAEYGIPACGHP